MSSPLRWRFRVWAYWQQRGVLQKLWCHSCFGRDWRPRSLPKLRVWCLPALLSRKLGRWPLLANGQTRRPWPKTDRPRWDVPNRLLCCQTGISSWIDEKFLKCQNWGSQIFSFKSIFVPATKHSGDIFLKPFFVRLIDVRATNVFFRFNHNKTGSLCAFYEWKIATRLCLSIGL